MKKLLTLTLAGALSMLIVQTVAAHSGPHDSEDTHRQTAQVQAQEARQTAKERTDQIRQEVKERRAQVKQDVCERRQEHLKAVIPRLSTNSNKLKGAFDKIYERIQGFYESGQLTVENYDELKAAADTAQVDAQTAVDAVNNFQFELNCDDPNVGQQLDGLRQASKDARTSLKSYREALVDLISSMRAEAAEQNAQNNTSGETNEQ